LVRLATQVLEVRGIGIIVVIVAEAGLFHPPAGINLFVAQGRPATPRLPRSTEGFRRPSSPRRCWRS